MHKTKKQKSCVCTVAGVWGQGEVSLEGQVAQTLGGLGCHGKRLHFNLYSVRNCRGFEQKMILPFHWYYRKRIK